MIPFAGRMDLIQKLMQGQHPCVEPDEVPRFQGPRVGIRNWGVTTEEPKLRLRSPSYPYIWKPDVNRAFCAKKKKHPAPNGDCQCGLYAYHMLDRWLMTVSQQEGSSSGIWGLVVFTGAVEVQRNMMRGEHARVLALLRPAPPGHLHAPSLEKVLDHLARYYRVPVIAFEDAMAFANEHALPVPPEVIPDYRESRIVVDSLTAPPTNPLKGFQIGGGL